MSEQTTNVSIWRTRPVFISSTFKDMHAERDWLRHHVFPRLEEALRARRHHLEPIDLRVGVETAQAATEGAREVLVLKVCLNEIQRSRPFLLVLLGDRYGWVPSEDRMRAAAQEADFASDVQGRSVTALEIEYGILKESPEQRRRCFFYFRDPLPYDQMPPELAAGYSDAHASDPGAPARVAALKALKTGLATDPELGARVRHYTARWDGAAQKVTGLETWGEQVFQDLWNELEAETREFAQQPAPTWEEVERAALAEFVEYRSRDFVGREELTRNLLALARSPAPEGAAWGACVMGGPGSGKSALFAHLHRKLAGDGSVLLLAHAAGISPRAGQVDALLLRWIQELAGFLRIKNPLSDEATTEDVDQAFASLLGRAGQRRRVVLLLDALNQFEPTPRARHLTWKPKLWPPNARLIATSLPGAEATALSQWAGVDEIELPPLTEKDAERISRNVWARYHRELNPGVLRALVGKTLPDGLPASGNPLWLTLANEQLNLLDADDFERAERQFSGSPGERLRQLLVDTARRLPAEVEGMYDWLLMQAEKVHGAAWVKAVASVLAVSQFGWRESDLRAVVPVVTKLFPPELPAAEWNDLKLAELRRAFRAHLMLRGAGGQWDFFHAQARAAVKRRNLADDGLVKSIHSALADHLESLSHEDPLHESETMFHLMGADEARRAARYYGGELTAGEAAGATRVLATHVLVGEAQEPNPALAWLVSLLDQAWQEHLTVANLCNRFQFDLHDAIESQSRLPTRLALHADTRASIERLAAADPSNAGWQRDLSVSYYKIADALEKSGDPSAIQFWRWAYGVLSGVKRKGWFISPQDERVLEQLRQKAGSLLHRPANSVDIPTPHPSAEPERAAQLNLQYQEELARWKALPWWKRLTIKKPEPPTGF